MLLQLQLVGVRCCWVQDAAFGVVLCFNAERIFAALCACVGAVGWGLVRRKRLLRLKGLECLPGLQVIDPVEDYLKLLRPIFDFASIKVQLAALCRLPPTSRSKAAVAFRSLSEKAIRFSTQYSTNRCDGD